LTNFFGEEKLSWLSSKNKVTDFQRHTNFLVQVFFVSHFVFRRQPAEIHQMKAGQNNKYDSTKTRVGGK
jgi:hypothetical protein